MNQERVESLLNFLMLAWPKVRDANHWRVDSCLLAGRIATSFLIERGVVVQPLPVQVIILNAASAAHFGATGDLKQAGHVPGGWSIGLGLGGDPRPGRWPGHLTVLVDQRYLLDLSLDQAARPQHRIDLKGLWLTVPETQVDGFCGGTAVLPYEGRGGVMLMYRAALDAPEYRGSPDWREKDRRRLGLNYLRKLWDSWKLPESPVATVSQKP